MAPQRGREPVDRLAPPSKAGELRYLLVVRFSAAIASMKRMYVSTPR
jgi:hypothetical protein